MTTLKIELHEIPIRDLVAGYRNSDEEGVTGFDGRLDIRPKYQREFVYNEKQRDAVINTVLQGFPLNVMYWIKLPDDRFEVMDGQQRTISICDFHSDGFSIHWNNARLGFKNLPKDLQEKFLSYKLTIYFCDGTDSEKLEWFQTVNIAGERLYQQEILNAIYAGEFILDAKRYFSKSNSPAQKLASKYLKGSPIRQDYLETALRWWSHGKILDCLGEHQFDPNADQLKLYFQRVIEWVQTTFIKYRSPMKEVEWGEIYDANHDKIVDKQKLETRIAELMLDDDVTKKSGIFYYVFDGDEKHLNIRAFTQKMKIEAFERQNGICAKCKKRFEIEQMEGDHIVPWSAGGKTSAENCQMLCKKCNRRKSSK